MANERRSTASWVRRAALVASVALVAATGSMGGVDAAGPQGMAGSAVVGLQVSNLDGAVANLRAEGVSGDSLESLPDVAGCSTTTLGADPIKARPVRAPRLRALEGGPVGAVARWDWFSSGGAVMAEAPAMSPSVTLPLVLVDYVSQNTTTIIRNPNDEPVSIQASIRAQGEAEPAATWQIQLAAAATLELDAAKDAHHRLPPNTPHGFIGAMELDADRPIAAWTLVDIGASDMAVYGFAGQPPEAAGEVLYAPLVRKGFFGFDTGIAVANPNDRPVAVTVDYIGGAAGGASECAGLRASHGPVDIPAFGGHVFYQGAGGGSGLPERCVGSAVIRAEGGPVQAIVNDALNLTQIAAAYRAVPAAEAATELALPLVRRQHVASWQMTTGIQVMNPGDAPAQVELALQPSDAASLEPCGPGCSATIPPLGTHTFYPGANGLNFMPPGSWGQGRLSSDRPILAIVNDWSETMGMDMSTYTALPCGGEGPTVVVLP